MSIYSVLKGENNKLKSLNSSNSKEISTKNKLTQKINIQEVLVHYQL